MDDNQKACFGFSLCSGVGPMTFIKLVLEFKTPHHAFYASAEQLRPFFFREHQFNTFISFRSHYTYEKEIKKITAQNIWVMTQYHLDYPKLLKNISDPPICIFGKGDRNSIDFVNDVCVGVVGARKPTPYGTYIAKELGTSFASAGLVIVSGMATGIDTLSHEAAIEKQGRTIAVLGTSIDTIYPYTNKELHDKILKEYGIVISEYPPGYLVHRGMFVMRNRIIVGLSKAIVVVEGGEHSGSLITARFAAENGRDVYAVPGPITSEMSIGPHILLREGAHVLTSSKELLQDFGLNHGSERIVSKPLDLTGDEKIIYDLLSVKKYYADEVAKKISLSITETLPILSLLEVRGIIGKDFDGGFIVLV
ncbi:MAG: DNA-processing protein DprA [Candidatus Roizmanbacteria bacterium]|nr:DNA-processing protein DprA [Candidatus Roizmanbacteria bacterium]